MKYTGNIVFCGFHFSFFQAKVLSKLSLHPNIISYYDSFEVDGTLMIEMEYADGG